MGVLFFYKDGGGMVNEGLSEYTYSLILLKIWTRYWENNSKRTNIKADEENRKYVGIVKVWDWKCWQFSSNQFWENIGCLILDHIFGFGGVDAMVVGGFTKDKWKENQDNFY